MTRISRLAKLGLAVVAAGIVGAVLVASRGPSRNALPSALAPYARELTHQGIHLRPLHAGTTVRISESAAKATALREFVRPPKTPVSAFVVSATDEGWGERQPDGTLRLEVENRAVWVVLIPSWRIPRHPGSQSTATVLTTLAVLVDANSGKYLEGATLA